MAFEFSKDNSLLALYACNAAILILKILFLTLFTAKTRIFKKVYANPEDAKISRVKVTTNEEVERIRRAHRNDLENIPAFLFISFLYILSGPNYAVAFILFWGFTFARIVHTYVYAIQPQPHSARGIAFGVGSCIIFYMSFQVLKFYW